MSLTTTDTDEETEARPFPDIGPPTELVSDWGSLNDLINDTAHRQTVPCRNGRDVPHQAWTGTNREQTQAAHACTLCPLIDACKTYGLRHPKEAGTYGGLTETQRTRLAATPTEAIS